MYQVNILTDEYLAESKFNEIISLPYKPASFQLHSFDSINRREHVLVTAHTGSGKTTVAEYAIAYWISKGKKIIYTSPIKSLSNEKYNEFKKKYSNISVGILTGDIKINPNAQCIIMTAEILRNALYGSPNNNTQNMFDLNDVGCVIMDEVHYINSDRGNVWEETIMLLPLTVQLVMLSATIDKAHIFAKWISDTRKGTVNLIPTLIRAVPLKHYIYTGHTNKLYKILEKENEYDPVNYSMAKKEYDIMIREREKKHKNNSSKLFDLIPNLIGFLKQQDMLQVILFSFSKKNCESYAAMVNINLITSEEKNEITQIFASHLDKYKEQYEKLDQYIHVKQLISLGVAYHHAGLLPVLKEIIEIIFKKGLIKVLFATETFAVGVNMPTRTVVFTELEKFTNIGKRFLSTAEYKQMSGRAGRRGIDVLGNVIIFPLHNFPDELELKQVMLGNVPHISSKFKIDYQFILKALQSEPNIDNIYDIMSKSLLFSENVSMINNLENELKNANIKFDALKSSLSDDIINSTDMKLIYNSLNEKTNFGNAVFTVSKAQQKQLQKIKSSDLYKNNYPLYCEYMLNLNNVKNLKHQFTETKNYINDSIHIILNLLQHFNFLSQTNQITQKGVVASQINECNPLLLTDMIESDIFADLNATEIVGILAIFIDPENKDDVVSTYDGTLMFKNKINKINEIINKYTKYETQIGIENYEQIWDISYEFMNAAMSWARNDSLEIIMQNIRDIYIGQFIRNMIKINNIAIDMIHLCEIAGKLDVIPVLSEINGKVMREFVNVNSLYC